MPPDNSPWGRNPKEFYAHLLSVIYFLDSPDDIVICGDVNGRVGNLNDTGAPLIDVAHRGVIDPVINRHCRSLTEWKRSRCQSREWKGYLWQFGLTSSNYDLRWSATSLDCKTTIPNIIVLTKPNYIAINPTFLELDLWKLPSYAQHIQ